MALAPPKGYLCFRTLSMTGSGIFFFLWVLSNRGGKFLGFDVSVDKKEILGKLPFQPLVLFLAVRWRVLG